jgi:hypothetical protein
VKRGYVWIIGGTLLAVGVAAAADTFAATPKRVALIGDSLAAGLTAPMTALAKASGVPFQAEGHVGSTVAQWLATPSWGAWVAGFQPSVVLVELGTNDYANPAPSLAQYRQLAAKFPGAVWVMPPVQPFNALTKVRAVISEIGVPVIPAMTGLQFGSDGIHPANYAPWAQFIWGQVP